ncbi:MAG: MFS transporter [Elusimicrobia bacterium]|nr:MFS transporter [Elusimicrobiota bacterium]MBI4218452.1 MFS transporter [Elusimicrobiota bacterium]
MPSERIKFTHRRAILAWAFYDFANSAFATTVLAVLFNVYFVKVICKEGVPFFRTIIPGESFWAYSVSLSTFLVFLLAPLLGAIADFSGLKKKFLIFFCILGAICTGFLYFCVEGDYWLAAALFILANLGFNAGNVFYNAFLCELSTPETAGRISGLGWALGYLGGGLLLLFNLMLLKNPSLFSVPVTDHVPVRLCILSVTFWWILFALPLFLFVPEKRGAPIPMTAFQKIEKGVRDILQTFSEIRAHKETFKFLVSYLIYNDGIETVILMASIFGAKELGMSQEQVVLCFLMIQAVAFVGSLLFGSLADKWSHTFAIKLTLWTYLFVCLWASRLQTVSEFWILGAVVGLILGGSQSASRSFLSLLIPPEKNAQFFGFFGLTGKLSSAIGPLTFGILSQIFSLRVAVVSLSVFFALGLFLLHFVQEPRGSLVKPQE